MIDVLLVLIIIFMVITPLASRGLDAKVPEPADPTSKAAEVSRDIVLTACADGTNRLNDKTMDLTEIESQLAAAFKTGVNRVVFVRGEREVEFYRIAALIDAAKEAGLTRVALMPR